MKRFAALTLSAFLVSVGIVSILRYPAFADLSYTAGSGTTIFDFVCFTTKHCSAHVPIDSAGGDMTDTTNHALKVVQPTAANLNVTEANSASILSAVQAAIPAGTATIGNVNGAPNVTATDCSGTITLGGTAQNAFTAQTTLHGFTIVNIDTTEPLWISFTTTAAASGAGSYPLQAATATTFASAGSFTTPVGFGLNHALSVVAATTSHKFTCTWW